MAARPRLRPVEAFPVQQNGTQGICLRDPLRYTEAILFVPRGLVPLLQMFDGSRDVGDIQAEVMRQYGTLVQSEDIQRLVDVLEDNHYLDSEGFAAYREGVERGFLDSPVRAPHLAGQAYPDSPEALGRLIDGFFVHPEGPGAPAAGPDGRPDPPAGAIIPHIDFGRGGPVYAHAYRALAESEPADVYVVLGTAHMGADRIFALTRKDFATPLGAMPADGEFIDALVEAVGEAYFQDELSHRAEHSIEFQAVLLHYLIARHRPVTLVPILCGSFQEFILNGGSPMQDPRVRVFVEGLKRTLASQKRRVCVIASVDLAHVGPRFGDAEPVSAERLEETKRKDLDMLERVRDREPEAFFQFVKEEEDRRNICGLTPIYTLLHVLEPREATLLKHGVAPDPMGTVTFASLLLR